MDGFSCAIRSFRALVLEGCPSSLLFHERILIISDLWFEEVPCLPCLCLLFLGLLCLECKIQLDFAVLGLYLSTCSHPYIVLWSFCLASFGHQRKIPDLWSYCG